MAWSAAPRAPAASPFAMIAIRGSCSSRWLPIPARTDEDVSLYHEYLAWDLTQWRDPKTRIVGSLTHGVVANNAWNSEIDTALGLLVSSGDTTKFADTVDKKRVETS